MSLASQLQNLAVRSATEFKSVRASLGTLANLTTTEKASLVGAINELRAGLAAGGTVTAAAITDATAIGRNILTGADGPTIRGLIGAGTSNLQLGTTSGTAKAGNYAPAWGEVSSKPAFMGVGTTAAEARDAIGAGTSTLALGTTSTTAKAGDYQPTWGQVSGKPVVIAAGATVAEARTAIGAGTSNLALGTTASTAKAGNYVPTWGEVSSKPAVIAAGADAAAARTVIGAISSADLDTRINGLINGAPATFDTLKEIADWIASSDTEIDALLAGLNTRVAVDVVQSFTELQKAQARSNIDVYSKAEIGNPETNLVAVFEAALV